MQNFIYLVERQSGRLIMLKRHEDGVFSFTFLPHFDSIRLARVTVRGLDGDGILQIMTHYSKYIVRAGVYAALGRQSEVTRELRDLAFHSGATEIKVEA